MLVGELGFEAIDGLVLFLEDAQKVFERWEEILGGLLNRESNGKNYLWMRRALHKQVFLSR